MKTKLIISLIVLMLNLGLPTILLSTILELPFWPVLGIITAIFVLIHPIQVSVNVKEETC